MDDFDTELDFIALNIDDAGSMPARQQYDIVSRSQYILLDASGQEVLRWVGPLNANQVIADINAHLGKWVGFKDKV